MSDALARPLWRGRTNVDRMTIDAIERAEALAGFVFVVTQGSYQSSVEASAGTHDRGGAIDFRAKWMTKAKRTRMVAALRAAGFAAWLRTPAQGPWVIHVHAVLCDHPDLSPSAQRQVNAYRAGRNGLANNGPDDGPEPLKEKPVPKKPFAGHMAAAIAELRAARVLTRSKAKRFLINTAITAIMRVPDHKETRR